MTLTQPHHMATRAPYTPATEAEALAIYRKLILIRRAQEKICQEYPKDEIKTPVHLGIGLEGISVGIAHLLPPGSKSFGQLRNHGQYLAVSGETDRYFGELYGRVTGMSHGKAGSMHLSAPAEGLIATSGIVAATISLAVGAGFAIKYRGEDAVAVAMFGDGAMEEGEFWESLNFACLHRLPVLFVCEDNDLAIHTFSSERKGYDSAADAVRGFNCHVYEGDGTDTRTVLGIVQDALADMRRDPRPAFFCFKYFRYLEHVGPNRDFGVGYRPTPTDSELRMWDPVLNFEAYLGERGVSRASIEAVAAEVEAQIDRSVHLAEAAPYPTIDDLYRDVLA